MQKFMIATDAASLAALNEILAEEEFEVSHVVSDNQGRWLILLDDDIDMFDDSDLELDYDALEDDDEDDE